MVGVITGVRCGEVSDEELCGVCFLIEEIIEYASLKDLLSYRLVLASDLCFCDSRMNYFQEIVATQLIYTQMPTSSRQRLWPPSFH